MFVSLVMLAALAAPENPPTEVRLPRKPYAFVTFGEGVLERASLVVEATAKSVLRGGHGVVVARFDVSSVMLGDDSVRTVTVLAPPDEFRAGVKYLLFLESYRRGGRYTAVRRIVEGDRDYAGKRRVLKQFAALHVIPDVEERARKIRDALLANLDDDDLFVRWNAVSELRTFAARHRVLFERDHRARLASVYRGAPTPTFARAVGEVLKEIGVELNLTEGS